MIQNSKKYSMAAEKSKRKKRDQDNERGINETPSEQITNTSEKAVDATPLRQDVPEEFRESVPNELPSSQKNTTNWSASQNRSDDLINLEDPFIQQPDRDNEIPSELIQERAYLLYEQRGGQPGSDLADWFEAERQLRGEIAKRKETNG
jgi:hypothetical protein